MKRLSIIFLTYFSIVSCASGQWKTPPVGGGELTIPGARQNTGWTAQGGLIAKDTVVARIEWGGNVNSSVKIFDADTDTILIKPQALGVVQLKDGTTVLVDIDSTGKITSGGVAGGVGTTTLNSATLSFVASDGDTWQQTITTGDDAIFSGASGGWRFSENVTVGGNIYFASNETRLLVTNPSTSVESVARFVNTSTGNTGSDGLEVGLLSNNIDAKVLNNETGELSFGTSTITRVIINPIGPPSSTADDSTVTIRGGEHIIGGLRVDNNIQLTGGTLDASTVMANLDIFSGSASHDTVTVSGAESTDLYFVTFRTALDATVTSYWVEGLVGKFAIHLIGANTGTPQYQWLRVKQ